MRKQDLKSLKLNKKSISNLKTNTVKGGSVGLPTFTCGFICHSGHNFCPNNGGQRIGG